MELAESIEHINNQLIRDFGKWYDGSPNWRVVLAGEQLEKRLMEFTDEGFELINPEVREVKKYQHIPPNYYVLERQVPIEGQTDVIGKTSYEPAWTFEDRRGEYLPPRFDACKFIIESIYSQIDKAGNHTKYKDKNVSAEERAEELAKMEQILFGNETPVGDALAHGFGVVVPGSKVAYLNPKETIQ